MIAKRNDEFRKNMGATQAVKGMVVMTDSVSTCGYDTEVYRAIRDFDSFTEDNDPYKEHDFGSVTVHGNKFFFKIDYYADNKCEYGYDWVEKNKTDPLGADKAFRVLTVMFAEEY